MNPVCRCLAIALVFCLQPAKAAEVPLETFTVESQDVPELRRFDGTVEAVNRATVSAQTSARVIEIRFDVDQFVAAGETIIRFDASEPKAALAQAKASLAEAVATREGAEKEFQRFEQLYKNRTVSRAQYDSARAAFDAASAREAASTAAVERAREQLQYTEVKAPFSGLVVERHVELGELASPGQPLMTGISLDELRVVTAVPQHLVGSLRSATSARVIDDVGNIIESTDLTVFPVADDVTHTVTVRVAMPAGTVGLFPGMLVRVEIEVGRSARILIPDAALVRRGELVGVYRINDAGEVRLQQVRVGRSALSGNTEILSGLQAGDQLAVDPLAATRIVSDARLR